MCNLNTIKKRSSDKPNFRTFYKIGLNSSKPGIMNDKNKRKLCSRLKKIRAMSSKYSTILHWISYQGEKAKRTLTDNCRNINMNPIR